MKTAIEWLMDQIKAIDKETYATLINEGILDEANGINKEQIADAFRNGSTSSMLGGGHWTQYYKQTYNK